MQISKIKTVLNNYPRSSTFFLGALTVFGFAPFYMWPLVMLVFSGFLYQMDRAETVFKAAILGALFCWGMLVAQFYWGHILSLQFFQILWPELPNIIVYAICIFAMSIFFAGAVVCFGVLCAFFKAVSVPKWAKPWFLAFCLVVAESFRGAPFEHGFPWGYAGYMLSGNLPMAQLASVGGIWVLNFLIIGCGASFLNKRSATFAVILLCIVWGGGQIRLMNATDDMTDIAHLRLVQASAPVNRGVSLEGRLQTFLDYENASKDAVAEDKALNRVAPKLSVWPEGSVLFFLEDRADLKQRLKKVAGTGEVIVGAMEQRPGEVHHNIVASVNGQGRVTGKTRKQILVPFGEYFPWKEQLWFLYKYVFVGLIEYEPGSGERILKTETAGNILVLNCFEFLFPRYASLLAEEGDYLLNVSNDVWFKESSALEQAFYMGRIRAIESGLSIVRAANGGISGVMDGYGRVQTMRDAPDIDSTATVSEVFDVFVPEKIPSPTIWVRMQSLF